MFSNEDLRKMMELAGVKNVPELEESDHIDLEIAVEPEDQGEHADFGVPDGISEPLAPTFEEPNSSHDEYGIPIDNTMPPEMGELPVQSAEGEPVVVALAVDDGSMGDGMDSMAPDMGGDCGCGAPECPACGGEMGGEPPMGHDHEHGDMTSHFASMPDDDFIRVIQGGMPGMEQSMTEFGNDDGEGSPVGSEEVGMEEELIEIEEEFDYSNGYDEQYMIDGEDYFPDGHDSNIRKKGGPLPDKADNNLHTTALPVDEASGDELAESLYNKYVEEYKKFLNESKD